MENTLTARYTYSISTHAPDFNGYTSVNSNEIIAEFELQGKPLPKSLINLVSTGAKYSNQDFDVLSSAMDTLNPYKPGCGATSAQYHEIWARIGKACGRRAA